jgi:hypothetical protein
VSAAPASKGVFVRKKIRSLSVPTSSFEASSYSSGESILNKQNMPAANAFDMLNYPEGSLLWQKMRLQENLSVNMDQEAVHMSRESIEKEILPDHEIANTLSGVHSLKSGHFRAAAECSGFSSDAKIETHAQWSLTALNSVFSRMTSTYMEQVDFTQIDFEAIEQA